MTERSVAVSLDVDADAGPSRSSPSTARRAPLGDRHRRTGRPSTWRSGPATGSSSSAARRACCRRPLRRRHRRRAGSGRSCDRRRRGRLDASLSPDGTKDRVSGWDGDHGQLDPRHRRRDRPRLDPVHRSARPAAGLIDDGRRGRPTAPAPALRRGITAASGYHMRGRARRRRPGRRDRARRCRRTRRGRPPSSRPTASAVARLLRTLTDSTWLLDPTGSTCRTSSFRRTHRRAATWQRLAP